MRSVNICFIIVIISSIILWHLEYTREPLGIHEITPPDVVVRDYMKSINQWDNIQEVDGVKQISYLGGGCGLPKGPFGYIYSIKMKDNKITKWCIPPHTATYIGYDKCNSKDKSCYKATTTKLPMYPNAYYSPDLKPTPPSTKKKTVKKSYDPSSITRFIRSLPDGDKTPSIMIDPVGAPWSKTGSVGSDFDSICIDTYNSNYGMLQIPKNQATDNIRAICSRGHRDGVDISDPGRMSTYCMPVSHNKKTINNMNKVCNDLYPKTHMIGYDPSFCPQPGNAKAICGFV